MEQEQTSNEDCNGQKDATIEQTGNGDANGGNANPENGGLDQTSSGGGGIEPGQSNG